MPRAAPSPAHPLRHRTVTACRSVLELRSEARRSTRAPDNPPSPSMGASEPADELQQPQEEQQQAPPPEVRGEPAADTDDHARALVCRRRALACPRAQSCPFCLEPLSINSLRLPCGHVFHSHWCVLACCCMAALARRVWPCALTLHSFVPHPTLQHHPVPAQAETVPGVSCGCGRAAHCRRGLVRAAWRACECAHSCAVLHTARTRTRCCINSCTPASLPAQAAPCCSGQGLGRAAAASRRRRSGRLGRCGGAGCACRRCRGGAPP